MNETVEARSPPAWPESQAFEPQQSLDRAAKCVPVRRRRQRLLSSLFILSAAAGMAVVFWYTNRVERRFQGALVSLKARNLEPLQYELVGLRGKRQFESESSLLAGGLLLHGGRPGGALDELEFAIDDPDTQTTALTLAGQALYQLGRFVEAERNLQYTLTLDPDQADAHRWLAIAYYDLGLMTRALGHLNKVAELEPKDPRPHRIMGLIRMDYGNYAAAIEDYKESLRRDPNQPDRQEIRLELAQTQMQLRQHMKALKTLSRCSQTADVLVLRAECHYNLGHKEESQQYAAQALKRESDHRAALLFLGKMAATEGDHQEAVRLLSRAVEAYPKDYDARYNLALAHQQAGQTSEGKGQMKVAEELLTLREEFNRLHQQAMDEPYSADIRYRLGVLADKLEMPILAQTWYYAALLLDPNHAEARTAAIEGTAAGLSKSLEPRP